MPATDTPVQTPVAAATIGRQVRLTQSDHAALIKAAGHGQQNAYIVKSLRAQLRRDGHLNGKPRRARRRAKAR